MRKQGMLAARSLRAGLVAMLALLASACSDTDDGGPDGAGGPGNVGLMGVAAVGAPITGGTITAKCSGGQTFMATTSAAGAYTVEIPASALPCALQVSGGSVGAAANLQRFHGYASRAGVANLTPLTDLAVALASGMNPAAWFNAISANAPPALNTLSPAVAALMGKLRGSGYNVPNNLNPLTTAFTTAPDNLYDQLLEALGAALRAEGSSHAELLVQVVEDGEDFSLPPAEDEGGGTGGGNGDTVPAQINAALVGSYTLIYDQAATGGPFADEEEVPAVVGADNTLQIDGKTLSAPFKRRFGGTANEAEIIWLDAAKQLEYALSNNSGGDFNEINVGDAANPQSTSGIPGFLGQLRKKPTGGNVPPQLQAIAGSYMPVVIERDNGFSQAIGSPLAVTIEAATGVIDIGDGAFRLDPAAEGYFFESRINSQSLYLISGRHTDGDGLSLTLHIEDDTISAVQLRRSREVGSGVFSSTTIYAEVRPLSQAVLDFFDAAVEATPVTLTLVLDDTSYASGSTLCQQIVLDTEIIGAAPTQQLRYELSRPGEGFIDGQDFRRSSGRYEEHNGNKRLSYSRQVLVLRADGFVDLEARFIGQLRDRATNDPAQVAAACPPAE